MIKILLVDDKSLAREALKQKIRWEVLGAELAGESANGAKALEIVKNIRPDLVITDIRMPEMDGLDLVKNIFLVDPLIKTIIISGYDDFKYAQQAVRYGCLDYLLKPVSVEELNTSIYKAFTAITKDRDIDLLSLNYSVLIENCENALSLGVASGNIEMVEKIIIDLFEKAFSNNFPDPKEVKLFTVNLLNLLSKIDNGFSKEIQDFIDNICNTGYLSSGSINETKQMILNLFVLCAKKQFLHDNTKKSIVIKIRDYIEKYYYSEIGLNELSNQFHISMPYLSRIFKEETGENLNRFITKIRIENAKKLIESGNTNFSTIGDKVGFSSYTYFHKVFEKTTGMTPKEYSKRC